MIAPIEDFRDFRIQFVSKEAAKLWSRAQMSKNIASFHTSLTSMLSNNALRGGAAGYAYEAFVLRCLQESGGFTLFVDNMGTKGTRTTFKQRCHLR